MTNEPLVKSKQTPMAATVAIKFAEGCRLVAAFALLLYATGALFWLIKNPSFVINQEVVALKQLQQLPQQPKQNSTGGDSGDVGKSSSALSIEVPIIYGISSVSVSPVG